jgi:site-specific DNA-methyltransferase (adenine-specific)
MYNVIECPDVPKNLRMYPTEKPVPLLQVLIKQSTSANGLVLDPFAGSGSTLVAAREAGRRGIGFEVDNEAYLRTQARLLEANDD